MEDTSKAIVQYTKDEREYLAALLRVGNGLKEETFNTVINREIAVVLKWTDEKTNKIFQALKGREVIGEAGGRGHLRTEGRKIGLEELGRQDEQERAKEKSSERRTFWIGFWSGIGSGVIGGLIVAGLVYAIGWNK